MCKICKYNENEIEVVGQRIIYGTFIAKVFFVKRILLFKN